jgi:FkbH-like protein
MSQAFFCDKNDELQGLVRPGGFAGLPAREVLLHATRLPQIETVLRELRISQGLKPFRISVLSSLSAQHFSAVLKLFLYSDGLLPEVQLGGFDGITTEALDSTAPVWDSAFDALLLLTSIEDIKSWPQMFSTKEEIRLWVESCAMRYFDIWKHAASRYPECRVYQSMFVPPLERSFGNLERRYAFSKTNCVAELNTFLLANAPPNVTLIDFDGLSSVIGRRQWVDETAFFTSKQPFSLREMPLVAALVSRVMAAARGLVRKCLVLDLDNTLWGGVIGDDGVDGIRLDPNDPVGESFLAFQRYLLTLKERGVLLAVCSKNDPILARSAFERHPDMLLRLDDFATFFANWDDKAINLRRIADQLNIGVDSLVFFDDNPAERELVRQFTPEVLVVNVPEDPALFIRALDMSFAFEWPQLTEEDVSRSDSYINDGKRRQLESNSSDYEGYLRSLKMRVSIEPTGPAALARVCQLINKTNQFNLRAERYSEDSLAHMANSIDRGLLHVRLVDCFSNYGIIASAVLQLTENVAFIENWVMSCRVFKRGVEYATYNAIVTFAQSRGAQWLVAEYIQTAKNGYVADLLDRLGFLKWQAKFGVPLPLDWGNKGQAYIQLLSSRSTKQHCIEVEETTKLEKKYRSTSLKLE